MPGIEWVSTLDNSPFISSMNEMQSSLRSVAALMGVTFGVHQLKQWGSEVMSIRGEFQKLEVAFTTMLGDAGKANALMDQLVKTAATTPFDLKSVAAGAKSLMAYGTAAEDVNNMLVRLGDIAAGMSIPLNDLVYLYGTTMVQGRMFTQDLRQFQGRGIPIADELAKVLNTTRDAIPGLVTAGKVTSDVFHQAIMNMSDAGGKFGGLMEAQSKTITGQISNIQDAFDMMYNDIGKSSEGIINAGLSSVSYLVENYEKVGKVILSLIAIYGEYKVAMLAANSLRKIEINALSTETEEKIIELKKLKLDEDLQERVATEKLTLAQAQEVQQRREVLRSLEEEIAKRKEARLAKISQQEAENESTMATLETTIGKNNNNIQANVAEIADIDKKIARMTDVSGKEAEINALQERRALLQRSNNQLLDANIANKERLVSLEKENANLAKEYLDVQKRYGSDEEKNRLLQETIDLRKQDLDAALEQANRLKEAADQETDAQKKETLAIRAQEAAEKAENIQAEINTLEEEKNTIATNGNTVARRGNTIATQTQATQMKIATLQQKINTVAQSEGLVVSKLFRISILQLGIAFNKLKLAIMTNPIGALVGAITLALPWIIEWISGTDDATDSEKQFGNEATEASSKVKALVNTIETADKNSKVYKDSVAELERIYKEYGIEVEKVKDSQGNEITNVEALTQRHGELINVLRQEAIERQKYQEIDDNEKNYKTKAEEAAKDFKSGLENEAFSESDKNAMLTLVDEEALQRAGEEMLKYNAIVDKLKEKYGERAMTQREATEQLKVFQDAMSDAIKPSLEFAGITTKDKEALEEAELQLGLYAMNVVDYKAQQIEANKEADKAADKAWKVGDANAKAARSVRYAKMSTSELKEELRHLVEAYGDTRLHVTIDFNQTNVPAWMSSMDLTKLTQQSRVWSNLAAEMLSGKKAFAKVNGKTFSAQEVVTKASQYVQAREQSEKKKAADEAAAKEAAEEAKKRGAQRKAEGERAAKEQGEQRAREVQQRLKHEEEVQKLLDEAAEVGEKARIASIRNDAERERRERDYQHRKTIQNITEQQESLFKSIYQERKAAYENAHKNDKDGGKYENSELGRLGWAGVASQVEAENAPKEFAPFLQSLKSVDTLTVEQIEQLQKDMEQLDFSLLFPKKEEAEKYEATLSVLLAKAAEEQHNYTRTLFKEQEERVRSLRDYLKQYGDFEERKKVLREEYEAKVAEIDPADIGARSMARAEYEKAMQALNLGEIQESINWETIFQDISRYSVDFLNDIEKQLQDAVAAGLTKGISAADLKVLTDKLQEVRDQISDKDKGVMGMFFGSDGIMGGSSWGNVAQMAGRQRQLDSRAKQASSDALLARTNANVAKTMEGMALQNVTDAEKKYGKGSAEALEAQEKLTAAQSKATETEKEASKAEAKASAARNEASNTFAASVSMTDAIVHGVNDNIQSANTMIQEWDIGSESFKETFAQFAESSQYATAAFDSLKNGDVFGTVFNLGEAFSSLGEAFGLWDNSNRKETEEANDKLARAMTVNTEALNRLTEKIGEGSIAESFKNYEQARRIMQVNEQAAAQTMRNNALMYDGSHSVSYKFGESDEGQKVLKEINRYLRTSAKNLVELVELPAQKLNELYADDEGIKLLTDLGEAITNVQTSGNYNGLFDDLLSYLNDFSEEAYDELKDSLQSAVTGVTFDSFKDSFKSTLLDMGAESKDFVDGFTKQLTEAFIDSELEEKFGKDMKDLYEAWNRALVEGLDASEVEMLQQREEDLAERMLELRDRIAEMTGYDDVSSSEASGSINAAKGMSDDTGNELVGRVTAAQMGVERGNAQRDIIGEQLLSGVAFMQSVAEVSTRNNEVLNDMLEQQVRSNAFLSDIAEATGLIYKDFNEKIEAIRTKIESI